MSSTDILFRLQVAALKTQPREASGFGNLRHWYAEVFRDLIEHLVRTEVTIERLKKKYPDFSEELDELGEEFEDNLGELVDPLKDLFEKMVEWSLNAARYVPDEGDPDKEALEFVSNQLAMSCDRIISDVQQALNAVVLDPELEKAAESTESLEDLDKALSYVEGLVDKAARIMELAKKRSEGRIKIVGKGLDLLLRLVDAES